MMVKQKITYTGILLTLLLMLSNIAFVNSQGNALIINGAFITLNGGTWASPVYLVVTGGANTGIVRNSGHIISEQEGNYVRWITGDVLVPTDFVFPFGYSTTDYLPVTIHKTSVGVNNASGINVSTWASVPANTPWASSVTGMFGLAGANATNSAIDRWWQIRSSLTVTATADLKYRGAENTTAFPLGLYAAQEWYDVNNLQWAPQTGSGAGVVAGIGTVSGITLVGLGNAVSAPYILTTSVAPLPIELISFTAVCENSKTHINWQDASETNVNSIELQKSDDLANWITCYTAAPSNQTNTSNYDFIYDEIISTTMYYRLKINNNDNETNYSQIIMGAPCNETASSLTAFYNNSSLNVASNFVKDGLVNYCLYSVQGTVVMKGSYWIAKGIQFTSVPAADLANGVYCLVATGNQQVVTQKIVIAQ